MYLASGIHSLWAVRQGLHLPHTKVQPMIALKIS
jgi:hypothetical protein